MFCSQACNDKAVEEYHQYLCTNNKTNDNAASSQEQAFIDFSKEKNVKYPYLIARFLATMVHDEIEKAKAGVTDGYSSWDHVDRFRYLELPASAQNIKELNLIKELLGPKVTGVDEFLTEERFLMLKGKILFNAYSVQSVANGEQDIEVRPDVSDLDCVDVMIILTNSFLRDCRNLLNSIESLNKTCHRWEVPCTVPPHILLTLVTPTPRLSLLTSHII